jgi:hypothetical protein
MYQPLDLFVLVELVPRNLISQNSNITDKVEVLANELYGLIVLNLLIEQMRAHNPLNNKRLNLANGVMRQRAPILNRPITKIANKHLNILLLQLQSLS